MSARGTPFPSSHRPPRAFYFFDYCYFYRDTQRSASLCWGDSNRWMKGSVVLRYFQSVTQSFFVPSRNAPPLVWVHDINWVDEEYCDHRKGIEKSPCGDQYTLTNSFAQTKFKTMLFSYFCFWLFKAWLIKFTDWMYLFAMNKPAFW